MWTWKWSPYGQLYNDINKCRTWAMHQQQNNMFHRPAACLPRSTRKRKWSADKRHQILLYFLIRALTHDCCKICRNLWADSIHPSSSFKSGPMALRDWTFVLFLKTSLYQSHCYVSSQLFAWAITISSSETRFKKRSHGLLCMYKVKQKYLKSINFELDPILHT